MSRSAIPGYLARSSAIHTTPPTLLERLREPANEGAWRRLVDLYAPLLFSWARRYGVAEHDAADLVQDVFVILLQTLSSFQYDRHRGQFRNWLRTLMLNKLRDRKRREAREEKSLAQLEPKAAGPDAATQFWEAEYQQELTGRALRLLQSDLRRPPGRHFGKPWWRGGPWRRWPGSWASAATPSPSLAAGYCGGCARSWAVLSNKRRFS